MCQTRRGYPIAPPLVISTEEVMLLESGSSRPAGNARVLAWRDETPVAQTCFWFVAALLMAGAIYWDRSALLDAVNQLLTHV